MTASLRLLVVDDESTNREITSLLLKHAGHEVVCCANGLEALALLLERHETFDAVLMDVVMPNMDGLEATRRLRASGRTRTIPIIGLSARATRRDEAAALAAGCDVYLTKPYRRQQLLEAIECARRIRTLGTEPEEDPPCPP